MSSKNIAKGIYNYLSSKLGANVEDLRELADPRIAICDTCEFKNKELNICNVCKCSITLKAMVKEESCPKDKW